MTGLGTDLVAVMCILGGAAVSGATTMAVVEGNRTTHEVACMRAAVDVHPRVTVSLDGGKRIIVMTPRVWVHPGHDCMVWSRHAGRSFHFRMHPMWTRGDKMHEEWVRMEWERARRERDRERIRAQQERSRKPAVPIMEQSAPPAIPAEAEKQIREQMRQLQQELTKLEAGTVR